MFGSPNFRAWFWNLTLGKISKWVWEIGWGRRVESREVVMFTVEPP